MTNLPSFGYQIPLVDGYGRPTFEFHAWWNETQRLILKNIEDTVAAALTANWSGVIDDNGLRPQDDATVGAAWATNLTGRPANLAALTGTEGIQNTLITLSASGTLSGAGGGSVTFDSIAGDSTYAKIPAANTTGTGTARRALIDFTQGHSNKSLANVDSAQNTKLNGIETGATVGANWSTNLTNRPTELTDGRITTALNSSGRLIKATNIFSSGILGIRATTNVSLTATDAGATATVNISAHSRKVGDVSSQTTVSYNSGSVTGLSFSTRYFIYTDDATYAGGAVTYVATTNSDDLSARAGRVYVGEVTTPADGGGDTGGSYGGGISGGGGGGTAIP